ncbi:MAG: GTPase ObgE [Chitinophagales bacterium]|jgi:GTP-binding protein|nr:GTPase ObgE [Chitinophagales bacterium]
MDTNFIDYVKLYCKSGKGGQGSVHYRREKFVPFGGPDGGNGGRGGHIIFRGNKQLWTLLHLKYQKHLFAADGTNGSGARSSGAQGKDLIIEVPLGTVIKDFETQEVLHEILSDQEEFIALNGGRGGMGNAFFKTATNQAPNYAQPGEPALEQILVLELKVLADVGLVGFPNAGKSTLLAALSAAKPEIANYPFTTLVPNLGIVKYHNNFSFCMADIPGIIEGASEGKGLGLRFLRHIERNNVLLFLIASDVENPKKQYDILIHELHEHNPELLDKDRIVAISKADLIDEEIQEWIQKDFGDIPLIFFSAITQYQIPLLKDKLWQALNNNIDVK